MTIQGSLRAQLLALLGGSILLLVIISLLCFRLLEHGVEDYQSLVNSTLQESTLVDQANLEFKSQVQEWKNVLLRGKDPLEVLTTLAEVRYPIYGEADVTVDVGQGSHGQAVDAIHKNLRRHWRNRRRAETRT